MTDEELVERVRTGDSAATQTLLERYKNVVLAKARRFYLVGGETEDLIQEGMVGLYEAMNRFQKGDTSFKTFASVCIERRIIDTVKGYNRKKNQPLNTSVSIEETEYLARDNPEEELLNAENRKEFMQTMGRALSAFEFQVTVLYMDGLSVTEISESVQKDCKSIDNALQRAKNKLRKERLN